jgi:glycosyltransferase involved in cell wall biosynthesis
LSLFGFDLTKQKEFKEADIIHIHWLSQGFIKLNSLSKIKKPIIWTMRDEWPYTGGSHYKFDFKKYEKGFISNIVQNYKKKIYKTNFQFIAVSNWLKTRAINSSVLKGHNILKIDNNIEIKDFKIIKKINAKSSLNIITKKQIILYGAHNPQSQRKGWNVFLKSLKKIDKSKFFLLIFGKFWSDKQIKNIGIEYKSCGYVREKKILNSIYSSADIFIASSLHDAWPKTFAEAMYCSTPTVCFDKTSISEIIDHKVNGYIAKKNNPTDLAKGIIWLSNQIKKNNSLNTNARNKIKNFDSNIIARKYLNLYNEKIFK